jgi:hypothetical protein
LLSHSISEEVEDKNPKISFSDAFESSFLTDEKWRQQHPNNTQYVLHLGLLQRMIVTIQESRLKQVSYDFTTQVPQAEKTVERLIEQMIIGETALPIHQQVVHVSTVSVPNGNINGEMQLRRENPTGTITVHFIVLEVSSRAMILRSATPSTRVSRSKIPTMPSGMFLKTQVSTSLHVIDPMHYLMLQVLSARAIMTNLLTSFAPSAYSSIAKE